MAAETPYESPGFDDLLAVAAPVIGEGVTRLLRDGKHLSRIGGWFERSNGGNVIGSVGDRVDLARRVLSDERISPSSLAVLLECLRGAVPDELPILLLVERNRGSWFVAVRRIRPRHRSPRFA
jgi:hypothetical protein